VDVARLVTVRFLDRPGDAGLVVPRRTARRLIRPHLTTSYVCCLGADGDFAVYVLDATCRLPPRTAEVWLLPKDEAGPARS